MKRFVIFILLTSSFIRPAQSAVIYSGLQNIAIPYGGFPVGFDGVYVDLDTGATSTSTILGWDVNLFYGGLGLGGSAAWQPARDGTGVMDTVLAYQVNDFIDSSLLYAGSVETGSSDHVGLAAGQFQEGVEAYVGFKFTTNASSGPYYGWMRVTLTANNSGGVISDWAYEDSGAGILAGAMAPEPGRMMLMMIGLCTARMRRRRDLT